MIMKVFLIRHGESEANAEGIHQGQRVDTSLSERGREQARRISKRLEKENIDAIYASDLKRARETAEIIAKPHKKVVMSDKRLREFDIGDWTSLDNRWIKFNDYKKSESVKKGLKRSQIRVPGGESEKDHVLRVKEFLDELLSKKEKNSVVVAHGGTNRIFFGLVEHVPMEKIYSLYQDNCCLNEIEFNGKKAKVSSINCLLHLDADEAALRAFREVRDEPLNVIKNRCWEKSKKLKELLTGLGYKVKLGICTFKWSKQKLPKDILELPHEDLGYHLFLWVEVHGDYLLVDSSDDSSLPSYNNWNGLSDCQLAVIPEEILSKNKDNKLEEKENIETQNAKKYREFYDAVNDFLKKVREK
jgi:broad specificity phosphatase PhoE